eukprot:1864181-Pyramimonas_sp.AAC.1
MVDGTPAILLDIGSNIIIIIGLETAQTFEQVPRSHGHAIKKLNLTRRLYVSGVEHVAVVCEKSLHCKIAREERGGPAGAPA